jgi:hypothetical protein
MNKTKYEKIYFSLNMYYYETYIYIYIIKKTIYNYLNIYIYL